MKKCLLHCIAFAAFASCSPKEKKIPKDILPVNKMKFIVWDMIRAGAYSENVKEKDTAIKILSTAPLAQVLKLHNIKKEDFFKSFDFYQAHPPLNKELFDSVSAYGQRQRGDLYRSKE